MQRPFSHEELARAVNDNPKSMVKVAKALTSLGRGDIRPQQVRQFAIVIEMRHEHGLEDRRLEIERPIAARLRLRLLDMRERGGEALGGSMQVWPGVAMNGEVPPASTAASCAPSDAPL